jgi:hypothetical protein
MSAYYFSNAFVDLSWIEALALNTTQYVSGKIKQKDVQEQ